MTANPRQKLDPREHAIFRGVWPLNLTERKALDSYFLLKISVQDFLDNVRDDIHPFKDHFSISGYNYEVEYIQCTYEYILDLPPTDTLLFSVRRMDNILSVVLVKTVENLTQADLQKYRSWVKEEE